MEASPRSLLESGSSRACSDAAASCTLDPVDKKYSWRQLWELEKHFKIEPYPDRKDRKILATRLKLKVDQVETWFIQRSLEQEMRSQIVARMRSARDDTSSCPSHKDHCCQSPSWRSKLIPKTSCEHNC